ncbi:MAG: PRC-barrel domain-containing protein [Nitrospinae bacterium]|nr:PRC-barrel domain-containing protein [Nitrospinota bacterium]
MELVTASSINYDLAPHHRVVGYYIYDVVDKDITDVRDLLVDRQTRKPRYAVIEIGGFLAIRGKKILIPWGALKKGGMSRLNVNREAEHVMAAPAPHVIDMPTRVEEENVHRHFGVDPYWWGEEEDEEKEIKPEEPASRPQAAPEGEPIGDLKLERDS